MVMFKSKCGLLHKSSLLRIIERDKKLFYNFWGIYHMRNCLNSCGMLDHATAP